MSHPPGIALKFSHYGISNSVCSSALSVSSTSIRSIKSIFLWSSRKEKTARSGDEADGGEGRGEGKKRGPEASAEAHHHDDDCDQLNHGADGPPRKVARSTAETAS